MGKTTPESEMEAPRAVALFSGDDEADAVTREALRKAGFAVHGGTEPRETVGELEAGSAALLVVDAGDPDAAGEVLRAAAGQEGRRVPAVVLLPSGRTPEETLGSGVPVDHFVSRPFRAETLAALCRAVADHEEGAAGTRPNERSPALRVRRPARFSARPLYGEASRYARQAFDAASAGRPVTLDGGRMMSERIHTSLLQSNLLLLRALEPYERFDLANHCVNVAVIAGRIALGLDLPVPEVLCVVQAGLIHDIGMARLPERILYKEGRLTTEERAEVERHPLLGEEVVRQAGEEWEWMARAVRQEHERHGGQGYPDGIAGDEIDPVARILGVADVFEAYSQVRSYRSPFTLYEALEKVTSMRDDQFARDVVDALANEISVFPLDSYVQLSSGEIGRVVEANTANLMRPTVEILWDGTWSPLPEPRRVDLAEHPDLSVTRPLHEAEVPIT